MHQVFLLILLFGNLCLASPLVIVSDIDDTVKVTNVQNAGDAIGSINSKESFVGMSQLYSSLINQSEQSQIFYVTGSPTLLKNSTLEFLLDTGLFLGSSLTTNSGVEDVLEYKVNAIRKILNGLSQDAVIILIGDDTQKDPAVYDKIIKEFSQVKARYLRRVKNNVALPEGSVQFESALDIAISEFSQSRLNEAGVARIANEIMSEKRRKRFFIKTTTCSNLYPGEDIAALSNLTDRTKKLVADAYKHTKKVCKESKF